MGRLRIAFALSVCCLASFSGLSCEPAPDEPSSQDPSATSGALLGIGNLPVVNESGFSANLSRSGSLDRSNEFFQSLGTNGRACVTCHAPEDGFSLTPRHAQELFARCEAEAHWLASPGRSPFVEAEKEEERVACALFRTNDGSNSPDADVSTKKARRAAYSMLLSKGLIRIGMSVPAGADFDVVAIDDPYGYATPQELSLFRRPLPSTNLAFDKSVMWDIRETSTTFIPAPFVVAKTLNDQLKSQADNATLRHAGAVASLTDAQLQSIVDFELGLFSAQVIDFGAGWLGSGGALGGVVNLSTQPVPANGDNTFGLTAFTPVVFTLYDGWAEQQHGGSVAAKRASIARGETLFNTRKAPGINRPPFFDPTGTTCSECHTTANTGGTNVPVPTAVVRVSEGTFRTPDMPLYTLQCSAVGVAKKSCVEGQTVQTTDPGRALVTGSWRSIDNFKVPSLRNLAARPPYFHNGSAATLGDVVEFYKTSMQFEFSDEEKRDLVNFLSAL